MEWTPKQREIIENRGQDLLVAAAAGSGKTAVLVEHILSLLMDPEHPVDVDRLLVVTFTKAAAAEMKERISRGLDRLLEEHPEQENLKRQQLLLHQAHISTIDSFCMWVVKNHFQELDIDPEFRIADEGELKLLSADVLKTMLEEKYQQGDVDFLRFVDDYTGGKNDDSLRDMILTLHQFAQSAPYPEEWLKQSREPFEVDSAEVDEQAGAACAKLDKLPFVAELNRELERELKSLEEQLTYAAEVMSHEPEVNPAYENTFLLDRELVSGLRRAAGFSSKMELMQGLRFSRKPAKKKGQELSEDEKRCSDFRDFIKDECTRLKKKYSLGSPAQMLEAIRESTRAMTILADLTLEFGERLMAEKRERNLADFSDVEHFALQLLDGPTPLARELSRHFEEIIVDEYQDSNLIQEKILSSISREPEQKHNRFMVGDVKQSIYKFRMARPELFMEKYARYGQGAEGEKKIDLSCNFRSRSTVLDSTNHVFYQLMGPEFSGISYTDEVALYAGADYPEPPEGCDLRTELLLVDGEDEEGLADSREWEARIIADRIRELVGPDSTMRIWNGEKGEYRPAEYRDIVILLRTMDGWAESFVRVLRQEGIPAVAEQRKGYFSAVEVQVLLNLLSILDNPRQDIPLMSVLVSPLGGFSEEEIARITAEARSRRARCEETLGEEESVGTGQEGEAPVGENRTLEALVGGEPVVEGRCIEERGIEEPAGGNRIGEERDLYQACLDTGLPKMQEFLEKLALWRDRSRYLPIHQLLAEILEESGYLHFLSALPAGETRRANVEMLQEMALNFEQTSYHGIFQFNRYIEQIRRYDVDYGEASTLSEQENLVRITSIHKSKGLEFPVVFVAGMGKQMNLQDARKTVVLHEDLGAASDYLDREHGLKRPTLWKRYVADRLIRDIKAEELRVLYVAMTRAREKLILTGTVKDPEQKWQKARLVEAFPDRLLPAWYTGSAVTYLDWLFMALARDSSGFLVKTVSPRVVLETEMQRQGRGMLLRQELDHLKPETVYDEDMRASIEEWRNYCYPYLAETLLRNAVSVSELKKGSREGTEVPEKAGEKASKSADISAEAAEKKHNCTEASLEAQAEREAAGKRISAPDDSPAVRTDASTGQNLAAERGTAYHLLLQLIPPEQGTELSAVRQYLDEFCAEGRISPEVAAQIRPEELVHFYQSSLGERVRRAAKKGCFYTERPFVMGLPAREVEPVDSDELILVQGIIDAYLEEEDGLLLLDYKTDRIRPGQEGVLIDHYKVQLEYYKKALEAVGGKTVKEGWLYSFALEKPVRVF